MSRRIKKQVAVVEDTKRVVSYVRISTDLQENSGLSTQEQQLMIDRFCQLRGLTKVGEESETISGSVKARDRPKLKTLLEMIDRGEASGIVVSKLDRLGRGAADIISLIDEFETKGIKFFSVQENIDCTTDIGRAMIRLLCVFANLERDMIKSRVQTIMNGKKNRGEQCGRCPLGMMSVRNEHGVKILVPNPDENETIGIAQRLRKTMVSKVLRSGKTKKTPPTYQDIAEELMRLGRKNRNGEARWFPSQIAYMMKIELEEVDNAENPTIPPLPSPSLQPSSPPPVPPFPPSLRGKV